MDLPSQQDGLFLIDLIYLVYMSCLRIEKVELWMQKDECNLKYVSLYQVVFKSLLGKGLSISEISYAAYDFLVKGFGGT